MVTGTTTGSVILRPCPVCGKMPRVSGSYNPGFAWCVIQCKPFLRKPHLKIEEGKASWDRALAYGSIRWNRRAENG